MSASPSSEAKQENAIAAPEQALVDNDETMMQESAGDAAADEDDNANKDSKLTLPTYNPLWTPLDLPSMRKTLCAPTAAIRSRLVKEGDTVIAYESRVSMSPLVMKRGDTYGNRFGTFFHNDMIGKELGTRISARGKNKGWIILLPFAPDLWTNSLTHRTQILYQADISYILFQLDLKPGDVVFESGTGSGSLTTALATTIAPHGHVHTFEFNAERAKKARVDFTNNKLSHVITVRERDVVGTGFPQVEGGTNAVFLDLPAPWAVIESSHAALKHMGRLCSFSPCIEQVQKVCLKLDEFGFSDIITVEILLRSFEVTAHHNFPVARPQVPQQRKWVDRNATATQPAATTSTDATTPAAGESRKRGLEESGEEDQSEKKLKLEDGSAAAPSPVLDAAAPAVSPAALSPAPVASPPAPAAPKFVPPISLVTTKPYQLMRGHTGYLTFATCNKF